MGLEAIETADIGGYDVLLFRARSGRWNQTIRLKQPVSSCPISLVSSSPCLLCSMEDKVNLKNDASTSFALNARRVPHIGNISYGEARRYIIKGVLGHGHPQQLQTSQPRITSSSHHILSSPLRFSRSPSRSYRLTSEAFISGESASPYSTLSGRVSSMKGRTWEKG